MFLALCDYRNVDRETLIFKMPLLQTVVKAPAGTERSKYPLVLPKQSIVKTEEKKQLYFRVVIFVFKASKLSCNSNYSEL